jgi:glycosyltransferase involved in cell wall biosynthesis
VRIVFATQKLDPEHRILAATVELVDELARRVDEVAVVADAGTLEGRPANVTLHTFGSPRRVARASRFLRAVSEALAPGADAFVAHQVPLYVIAAWPLAKRHRVPVLLWYSHWRRHLPLRLSEKLATLVVSADPRSFPLASAKVRPIGQAVELPLFPPLEAHGESGRLRAVALGRYSPAKGLPVVLEAVASARASGVDVSLVVHGSAGSRMEREHRISLDELVQRLGLEGHVVLGGPLPRAELPALFAHSDVLVNNMQGGSADKVVYEAGASRLPVLASNPVHDELVAGIEPPLLFGRARPDELAARLAAIAGLSPEERLLIGSTLRERVAERHSVRSWVDGLLAAVAEAGRQ